MPEAIAWRLRAASAAGTARSSHATAVHATAVVQAQALRSAEPVALAAQAAALRPAEPVAEDAAVAEAVNLRLRRLRGTLAYLAGATLTESAPGWC